MFVVDLDGYIQRFYSGYSVHRAGLRFQPYQWNTRAQRHKRIEHCNKFIPVHVNVCCPAAENYWMMLMAFLCKSWDKMKSHSILHPYSRIWLVEGEHLWPILWLIQQLLTHNAFSGSKNCSSFDLFELTNLIHIIYIHIDPSCFILTYFDYSVLMRINVYDLFVHVCSIFFYFVVLLQVGSPYGVWVNRGSDSWQCAKELQPSPWLQQGPAAHDPPCET